VGATWGARGEDGEGLEYFGGMRARVRSEMGRLLVYYLPMGD
jgi:hypothetical protein